MLAVIAIGCDTRNSGPSSPVTARQMLSNRPHSVTSMKCIDVNTTRPGKAQGNRKTASSVRRHQLRLMKKPDNRNANTNFTFTPTTTNSSVFIAVVR